MKNNSAILLLLLSIINSYSLNAAQFYPPDNSKNTVLHYSAYFGRRTELVNYLQEGHNPNTKNSVGESPLFDAVRMGYEGITCILIRAGADVNHLNRRGQSPLYIAFQENNLHLVAMLLKAGAASNLAVPFPLADYKVAPLLFAVSLENVPLVKSLVDHGAKLDVVNERGQTSLHLAAGLGRFDILRLLLASAKNIDAVDKYGETALHAAVRAQSIECVGALVKAGADFHKVNSVNKSAVSLSVDKVLSDITAIFLSRT